MTTLPTKQYLVAFNNGPFDDPANITTVASPAGTLGGVNVWTDITPWVQGHKISRGRQHELRQFEAGTCQMGLSNVDARFNPWNASGPYFGLLLPRKLMQVRVTWAGVTYTRFTGHVDAWPIVWSDPISGWATLHATDAFRLFNLNNVTSTGYPAQVAADGVTGYWRLGDPVGSTYAADSSGNNKAAHLILGGATAVGTLSFGSPGFFPADPNTSATLTANNANTYLIPAVQPAVTGGLSVEWWMTVQSTFAGAVVARTAFTVSGTQYSVECIYPNTTDTTFGVSDGIAGGGGSHTAVFTVANLTDGLPHHCVVTLNTSGSVATSWVATVYIDGVSVGSVTFGAGYNNASTLVYPRTATYLALETLGNDTANLQDWAIYPSVLSAGQVAALHNLAAIPQQTTDARIGRILDIVGWSSTARNLDTNTSGSANGFGGAVPPGGVQAVTSALTTTSCLAHMQDVEATEGGALFMTTDGKVRFVSRQTLAATSTYTSSQQTIGDNFGGGDLPFDPNPTLGIDDIDLYNEAVATRQGGLTQRYTDPTSIAAYGRVTWQPPAALLGNSDSEVLGLAQYAVSRYKTPVVRIQSVTVDLHNLISPNLVANLLTLDLLYAITLERVGVPGGGTSFSQLCNIEHIDETSTPDTYTIAFGTAVANPAWWVLGTSTLGQTTTLYW